MKKNNMVKTVGIILIIFWILGFLGIVSDNSYPDNIFTWFGTMLPLIIGVVLVSNNKLNSEYQHNGFPKWLKITIIIIASILLISFIISIFNFL